MDQFRRIPSSHAAAALGFADWSTPLATYMACRDVQGWDENPEEPKRGVRLKPALRAWASTIRGAQFLPVRADLVVDGRTTHLSARPAGVTRDGEVVLLVKTPLDLSRWYVDADEHGDEMPMTLLALPLDVRIECAALQTVLRPKELVVAVLLGGQLKLLKYAPSASFEEKAMTALHIWRKTSVLEEKPPKARRGDDALLRKLFPKVKPDVKLNFDHLTPEYQRAVLAWAGAQRKRTAAQKAEKDTRPMVVQAIADATGIVGFPAGSGIKSVTFDEREPYANNATWNAIAHELLEKLSPRAQKRLLEKYTPQVGTRVLRPFFEKEVQ